MPTTIPPPTADAPRTGRPAASGIPGPGTASAIEAKPATSGGTTRSAPSARPNLRGSLHATLRRAALPILRRLGATPRRRDLLLKMATWPSFDAWWREHRPAHVFPRDEHRRGAFFTGVRDAAGLAAGPVTYLEFGVYRGASIRWWSDHDDHAASRFVGFDSFTGLPERWTDDKGAGTFDVAGAIPDIDDPRVRFVPGWFHLTLSDVVRTLPGPADRDTTLVVHLDADLYRSTSLVLTHLGPHLRPGDVLVFDEFADSIHEYRAFEDFQATFAIDYHLIAATEDGHRVAIRIDQAPGPPRT